MSVHLTKEKILALNPHIDEEELKAMQRILKKIRTVKGRKNRHNLVPPFERPRVTVGESDKKDSRTVILQYSKK